MTAHTSLIPFQFQTHQIRVVEKDGEPWFVATDIASVLGYADARHMTRMLDDDEAGLHIVQTRSENGVEQKREVAIINESGLYLAVLKSRKPEAKPFRKWVTAEVLPTIRKTGGYAKPQRILISLDGTSKLIPNDAYVLTLPQIVKAIGCPHDLPLSAEQLVEIISHASGRLKNRALPATPRQVLAPYTHDIDVRQQVINVIRDAGPEGINMRDLRQAVRKFGKQPAPDRIHFLQELMDAGVIVASSPTGRQKGSRFSVVNQA